MEHSVRFFPDDAYPDARIADFVERFRDRGEPALLFATSEHQHAITGVLERRGIDVARASDERLLAFADAESAARCLVEHGRVNKSAFDDVIAAPVGDAVSRFGRVAAYGEIVDVLARNGDLNGAIALEELWSDVLERSPLRLLCGYSFGAFVGAGSTDAFSRVCGKHSKIETRNQRVPLRGLRDVASNASRLVAELEQRTRALEYEVALRAEIERERDLLLERVEAANRAKDEFLAMLGHELRNPLSPILTAVQLMRLRADGALVKERSIIERQVAHMVRLVDDLLDVSRIARGKVELRMEPTELGPVVGDAVEMASPLLEERGHRLHTQVPPKGLRVSADPERLAQVVANLLMNAAKYTPPHGVISITARRKGRTVELEVKDDGVGIDPTLLPRVFDLFVQGRQAADRPNGGLGLGLAIARNLAEMHGGSLRAESSGIGRGSVFTLELALLSNGKSDPSSHSMPHEAAHTARRILVVDDNRDAAEAIGEYLEALGHVIRVAHDGVGALEVASAFHPEVALLDLGLPVMDGHELAVRLASLLPAAPPTLIAITGYGDDADRERSSQSGFSQHLVKPVDLTELSALIERT